jgi:UDP-N-acetylmuramoylalanine--D-glutamate ligase
MNIKCVSFDTLKEAFHQAFIDKEKGDIVLLSPAHASWDQYKCFEDRGDEFKEFVKEKI